MNMTVTAIVLKVTGCRREERYFEKWGLGEDFQSVHSLTLLNKWNLESKSERKQRTHLKWVEKLLDFGGNL